MPRSGRIRHDGNRIAHAPMRLAFPRPRWAPASGSAAGYIAGGTWAGLCSSICATGTGGPAVVYPPGPARDHGAGCRSGSGDRHPGPRHGCAAARGGPRRGSRIPRGRGSRHGLDVVGPAATPAIPVARKERKTSRRKSSGLRHRVLDLRRPSSSANVLRHRLMQATRRYSRFPRVSRDRDARSSPSPRPRARATIWCRVACIPASSTRCRNPRSSTSSC